MFVGCVIVWLSLFWLAEAAYESCLWKLAFLVFVLLSSHQLYMQLAVVSYQRSVRWGGCWGCGVGGGLFD